MKVALVTRSPRGPDKPPPKAETPALERPGCPTLAMIPRLWHRCGGSASCAPRSRSEVGEELRHLLRVMARR